MLFYLLAGTIHFTAVAPTSNQLAGNLNIESNFIRGNLQMISSLPKEVHKNQSKPAHVASENHPFSAFTWEMNSKLFF